MTDWHIWREGAAADRVRSLVSGFPGDKSRLRVFMILQACLDDSYDKHQKKLLVIAGYIATAEAWVGFTKEWEQALSGWKIPAYKFARDARSSNTEIDAYFYRIIENHDIPISVDVVIDIEMLNKVANKLPWRSRLGFPKSYLEKLVRNPYHLATKAIMQSIFNNAQAIGFEEPIDLIFDEKIHEKKTIWGGWDYFKNTISDDKKAMIGDRPDFKDDEKFLPLQAADLVVGHVRQYEESSANSIGRNPFPWAIKKDIKRFCIRFTEENLEKEIRWICGKENLDQFKSFSPELFS